jgi:heavy metal translocating P-type ATPase
MTAFDADFCAHCRLPLPQAERPGPATTAAEPRYCCSGCRIAATIVGEQGEHGESAAWLIRLAGGVFLSMFVKTIAWVTYAAEPGSIAPEALRAFSWLMFAAGLPVLVLLGRPFAGQALREIVAGRPGMDTLITLGVAAGFGASVAGLFAGGAVWFDTVCMILVLTTLGRLLESAARAKARDRLTALLEPAAPTARRITADGERETPAAELQPGDLVRVRPGEEIPADGIIRDGAASVEQAVLTGESAPVCRSAGDPVLAGAVDRDGVLTVEVTQAGEQTRRGRIAALVRATLLSRGRTQRLVDRVSAVFVGATTAVAAGTFAYWAGRDEDGATTTALMNALAVVLAACPCALGLATPLATVAGVSAALRHGALLREADALERLASIRHVAFDKTGTLTDGRFAVRSFEPAAGEDAATALAIAAALEAGSEHPIAGAVAAFAAERGGAGRAKLVEGTFRARPGGGVTGVVELDGRRFEAGIGSVELFRRECVPGDGNAESRCGALPAHAPVDGATAAVLWWNGRVRAEFALGDRVRAEAGAVVAALRRAGSSIELLSGDGGPAVRAAAAVGITEFAFGLSPEEKRSRIAARRATGAPVAFVGDGINDGPALSAATVGIAAGGGTDLARHAADVSLLTADLRALPTLFELADAVVRTIRMNLFWAFAYNAAALTAAAAGMLSPAAAAAAMAAGSLCVVGNSLRLRRFDGPGDAATNGSPGEPANSRLSSPSSRSPCLWASR